MSKAKLLPILAFLVLLVPLALACGPAAEPTATPTPPAPTPTKPAAISSPTPLPSPIPTATPSIKKGGVFKVAFGSELAHFDAGLIESWPPARIQSLVVRKLLRANWGPGVGITTVMPLQLDLAKEWQQTSDTTWIFKLQQGIKFQNKSPVNGREMTADDVVYSLTRVATHPLSPYKARWAALEKVEALDRYTVKVTLKEPYAPVLLLFVHESAAIRPKEAATADNDFKPASTLIGQGPFILQEHAPGSKSVFIKNPDYWKKDAQGNPLPYLDGVEVVYVKDFASQLAALATGKLDDLRPSASLTLDQLDAIKRASPTTTVEVLPGMEYAEVLFWRNDKPPFNDVRVRRAVSLALNRQEIIDTYYRGYGKVSTDLMYLQEYVPDLSTLPQDARHYLAEYNPEEARRLLAEAGFPNGFETTLIASPNYVKLYNDLLPIAVNYLANIGIKVTMTPKEYGAFVSGAHLGKFDEGMVAGYGSYTIDPDDALYSLYHPDSPMNKAHVNDPVLTDLVVKQRRTLDLEERKKVLRDIVIYNARMAYMLYFPIGPAGQLYQPWVKNFYPKDRTLIDYGTLEDTWLDR